MYNCKASNVLPFPESALIIHTLYSKSRIILMILVVCKLSFAVKMHQLGKRSE